MTPRLRSIATVLTAFSGFEIEYYSKFAFPKLTTAERRPCCPQPQAHQAHLGGAAEGVQQKPSTMASHRREWSVRWDIEATLDFICSQAAQRVTLQFPDDLLDESSTVAASIQQGCRERGRPEVQVPCPPKPRDTCCSPLKASSALSGPVSNVSRCMCLLILPSTA